MINHAETKKGSREVRILPDSASYSIIDFLLPL